MALWMRWLSGRTEAGEAVVVDDPLAIHGARNGLQGLAARQTLLKPSPVLSPGLVSLAQ